jgi:hypothetical protein
MSSLTVLSSPAAIYLAGESGLLTLLATAAVTLWLLKRHQTAIVRAMALET